MNLGEWAAIRTMDEMIVDVTKDEEKMVKEAWAEVDSGFLKVRAALVEAAERLEQEKDADERELELGAVFAPAPEGYRSVAL